MERSTSGCHKQIPPQADASPAFCSITSALKAPCCTILESISDGVFTIDLNKRVTSFNQAAELITGFKGSEAVGQYCFDVFRANICEKKCALDQTLQSGQPKVNLSALIISKSGVQKPISISTAILKTDGTTICGESMWDLPGEGPVEIARRLADLGVEKLICGGIQNQNKEWLMAKGIMVVDNQKGVAREIVRAHLGSPCDHVNLSPSMKEDQTDGHEKLC